MVEYKFVKLDLGFLSGTPDEDYHHIIEGHGKEGWELVQIFAPSVGLLRHGSPSFFELIFKRSAETR